MKRDDVLKILHDNQKYLAEKYQISYLAVFGSVARDEARIDSDVDLLVKFNEPIGLFKFIELQQHLEKLLGCKVDLGTTRSIKPHLKASVFQEAIRVT